MSSTPRIIYVCSAARCGSTVTDMLLGSHQRIASLGEANFLSKAVRLRLPCTCGALVQDCSRWSAVFKALKSSTGVDLVADPYAWPLWHARARVVVDHEYQNAAFEARFRARQLWLMARAFFPAAWATRLPLPPPLGAAIENKFSLCDAIADRWDRDVIVDSSKNPFEAIELARRRPDRTLIVLLTRDGRGVYLSKRSSGFSREQSVAPWVTYYRRTLPLLQQHVRPSNLLIWRYEDVASEPERFSREICERTGLTFDSGMLALESDDRHMVGGNDTRFSPSRGVRLDERWRRELQGDELSFFQQRGGRMNEALGYA